MDGKDKALERRLADLENAVLWIMDVLIGTTDEDDLSLLQDEHLAFVERIRARRLKEQR